MRFNSIFGSMGCNGASRTNLCDCNCRSIYSLPEYGSDLENADMLAMYHKGETYKYSMFNLSRWIVKSGLVGTGIMTKSIYDKNDNGIVDDSEKLNGYTYDQIISNIPQVDLTEVENNIQSIQNDLVLLQEDINNTKQLIGNGTVELYCGDAGAVGGFGLNYNGNVAIDLWSQNRYCTIIKGINVLGKFPIPSSESIVINLSDDPSKMFYLDGDNNISAPSNLAGSNYNLSVHAFNNNAQVDFDTYVVPPGGDWLSVTKLVDEGSGITQIGIHWTANTTGSARNGTVILFNPTPTESNIQIYVYQPA